MTCQKATLTAFQRSTFTPFDSTIAKPLGR
jgi:hypothetical protein